MPKKFLRFALGIEKTPGIRMRPEGPTGQVLLGVCVAGLRGADPCRSHLPESSAGFGTLPIGWIPTIQSGLPRFLRAGPSTSLDKSDSMQLLAGTIAEIDGRCQAVNVPNVGVIVL